MNNSQDWYFQKVSDVLFVDEDTQRVGILEQNPSYTLDVDGTINTSNILGINASLSNIQADLVVVDTIIAGSNLSEFVQADNAVIENVECVNLHASSNAIIGSNLGILNTWLNNPCPYDGEANYFGYNDQGWIHSSWIHTDPDMMQLLEKLWNIAAAGWDIFDAVQDVYRYLNPNGTGGALADDMKNTLNDALDQIDENPASNQLSVSFWNLNNRPFMATTDYEIGVKGDMYINEAKSIYSLNGSYFVPNYKNNQTLASTIGKDLILNVGTKEAFLNTLHIGSNVLLSVNSNNINLKNFVLTSNAIINSNVSLTFNSNSVSIDTIINNDISSSNLTSQTFKCGNYTITNDGIYTYYDDILLRKKVLDNQGNYVGSLYSSQVIGFDALNFDRLKDGVFQFNGLNINTSIDQFTNIGNPLYVI